MSYFKTLSLGFLLAVCSFAEVKEGATTGSPNCTYAVINSIDFSFNATSTSFVINPQIQGNSECAKEKFGLYVEPLGPPGSGIPSHNPIFHYSTTPEFVNKLSGQLIPERLTWARAIACLYHSSPTGVRTIQKGSCGAIALQPKDTTYSKGISFINLQARSISSPSAGDLMFFRAEVYNPNLMEHQGLLGYSFGDEGYLYSGYNQFAISSGESMGQFASTVNVRRYYPLPSLFTALGDGNRLSNYVRVQEKILYAHATASATTPVLRAVGYETQSANGNPFSTNYSQNSGKAILYVKNAVPGKTYALSVDGFPYYQRSGPIRLDSTSLVFFQAPATVAPNSLVSLVSNRGGYPLQAGVYGGQLLELTKPLVEGANYQQSDFAAVGEPILFYVLNRSFDFPGYFADTALCSLTATKNGVEVPVNFSASCKVSVGLRFGNYSCPFSVYDDEGVPYETGAYCFVRPAGYTPANTPTSRMVSFSSIQENYTNYLGGGVCKTTKTTFDCRDSFGQVVCRTNVSCELMY